MLVRRISNCIKHVLRCSQHDFRKMQFSLSLIRVNKYYIFTNHIWSLYDIPDKIIIATRTVYEYTTHITRSSDRTLDLFMIVNPFKERCKVALLHPSYMWLLISSGYDQLTSTISILRFSYRGFRTFITVIKDLSHHR